MTFRIAGRFYPHSHGGTSSLQFGGSLSHFRQYLALLAETEIRVLYSMWQHPPDTKMLYMRLKMSQLPLEKCKHYNGLKYRAFSMGCDKLYPQPCRPSGISQKVSLGMLISVQRLLSN